MKKTFAALAIAVLMGASYGYHHNGNPLSGIASTVASVQTSAAEVQGTVQGIKTGTDPNGINGAFADVTNSITSVQ